MDPRANNIEKANNINLGTSLQHENIKNQLYRNSQSYAPMKRTPEMRSPNVQLPSFHQ
jgi:hypothetical protein